MTEENKLFENPKFIDGLERAIKWCEDNQQKCTENGVPYTGWNSGGYLETLEKGHPESWATAVVHMFLWELTEVISQRIQKRILEKYSARAPKKQHAQQTSSSPALDAVLDIDVLLKGRSLAKILRTRILGTYKRKTAADLRRFPSKDKPLSALLFGPPGTSKTEITKAVADDLGWAMVEITPSQFVRETLANVYLQADTIFEDLMDLSGVVVFFDEMDALVQTREGEVHLDIMSQFLTTTMLPKLARLHDKGQVVFFMATNYQDRFDDAIKRSGRFDLLLCMGPPKLNEKLNRLHRLYLLDIEIPETAKAGTLIREYLEGFPRLEDQLALYTFGEFKALLRSIAADATTIASRLAKLGPVKFRERLEKNSNIELKIGELEALKDIGVKWMRINNLDDHDFNLAALVEKKKATKIIRYFYDRKQSKEQY